MKKIIVMLSILFVTSSVYSNEIRTVSDFNKYKGVARKELFITKLIPIIEKIKTDITEDKEKLEKILSKKNMSEKDKVFVENLLSEYKAQNIEELKNKMILPPTSLILAQASLESGWGRSDLSVKANNLFGMKSFSKDNAKSIKYGKNTYYKRYATVEDSIKDYIMTLSRHRAYGNLREAISNGDDTLELVKHLNSYSEMRSEYGKMLVSIVNTNNLTKLDA